MAHRSPEFDCDHEIATQLTLTFIQHHDKPGPCTISLASPVSHSGMPFISADRAVEQGMASRVLCLRLNIPPRVKSIWRDPERLMQSVAEFDNIDAFVAQMGKMKLVRSIFINIQTSDPTTTLFAPEAEVAARYTVAILQQLPAITLVSITGTFGDIPPSVFSVEIPAAVRAVRWKRTKFEYNSAADARFLELVGSHAKYIVHSMCFALDNDAPPQLPTTRVLVYRFAPHASHTSIIQTMRSCPNLKVFCVARNNARPLRDMWDWIEDQSGSHARLEYVWGATEALSASIRARYPMLKPTPTHPRVRGFVLAKFPVRFDPATSYINRRLGDGPILGRLLGAFYMGIERVGVSGTDPAALEYVARSLTSRDGVEGPASQILSYDN